MPRGYQIHTRKVAYRSKHAFITVLILIKAEWVNESASERERNCKLLNVRVQIFIRYQNVMCNFLSDTHIQIYPFVFAYSFKTWKNKLSCASQMLFHLLRKDENIVLLTFSPLDWFLRSLSPQVCTHSTLAPPPLCWAAKCSKINLHNFSSLLHRQH